MSAPPAPTLTSDVPIAARESFKQVNAQVLAGLDRAAALAVGSGYLEATAGVNSTAGLFGRLEAGYRATENLSVFGYGQVSSGMPGVPQSWGPVVEAGIGARLTFP